MALLIEVCQLGDKLWAIATHQLAESDDNPDWEALQRVADEGAEEAFRLLEVRDTLRVLIERTPLEQREREVIALFLQGLDFIAIAKRLGISRQSAHQDFHRAVAKLRKTANALGIAP